VSYLAFRVDESLTAVWDSLSLSQDEREARLERLDGALQAARSRARSGCATCG
jgi:hypothetical protein